jgi:hypothetical protein
VTLMGRYSNRFERDHTITSARRGKGMPRFRTALINRHVKSSKRTDTSSPAIQHDLVFGIDAPPEAPPRSKEQIRRDRPAVQHDLIL